MKGRFAWLAMVSSVSSSAEGSASDKDIGRPHAGLDQPHHRNRLRDRTPSHLRASGGQRSTQRLLEKAGMVLDGRFGRSLIHRKIAGRPRDAFVYSAVR